MRSRRRRLPALLAAAGTLLAGAATGVVASGSNAAATTVPAGVVQRSGTQLVLDGAPYRFTGYQIGLASSPAHPLCSTYTDAQVGAALAQVRQSSGANAVRVWMFQGYGGPQDWGRFDLVFAEARKAGVRVVATLTNQWGDCEPRRTDGSLVQKRLSWYQSGYRSPDAGYPMSYRSFVAAMATRYAAEPALLAWQLVNEAEANTDAGGCDEAAGAAALRAFSDDMVGVVRGSGDQHLVGLGSMGSGQCGLSGSASFRHVHGGALDMCEYHDYTPMSAVPGDAWNGLAVRVDDCKAVGKPLFVGEAGIPAGIQPDGSTGAVTPASLALRAELFDDKLARQTAAGVAGFVVWQRAAVNGDGFTVFDGDPVEPVLMRHRYVAPSPTPTATSTRTVTTVLRGNTGSRGSATLRLSTGSGPLSLAVQPVSVSASAKVVARDPRGLVVASGTGALPLKLHGTVPAGTQSISVSGPRRLRFTVTVTHVAP